MIFRVPKRSSPDTLQCRESTSAASRLGKFQHFKTSLLPSPNLTSPRLTSSIWYPNPHLGKIYSWGSSSPSYCSAWGKLEFLPQQLSLKKNATLSMTTCSKLKQRNKKNTTILSQNHNRKGTRQKAQPEENPDYGNTRIFTLNNLPN